MWGLGIGRLGWEGGYDIGRQAKDFTSGRLGIAMLRLERPFRRRNGKSSLIDCHNSCSFHSN